MVPGFSSMHSMNRLDTILIMLFILIFVFVFDSLKTKKTWKIIIAFFPVLVIADNLIRPSELPFIEKKSAQEKVNTIADQIRKQRDDKFASIVYIPAIPVDMDHLNVQQEINELNLKVMLAAQQLNVPCVNAYSGHYPGNYPDLFISQDDETLERWCLFNGTEPGRIQVINDFNRKESARSTVFIKAFDGKFLCSEPGPDRLVADRNWPGPWEKFTLIRLEQNKWRLSGYHHHEILDRDFTIVQLDHDRVSFHAADGKVLSVDTTGQHLLRLGPPGIPVPGVDQFELIMNRSIKKRITEKSLIQLRSSDSEFVCVDETNKKTAVANREFAGQWETLLLIRLDNGKVLLQAYDGLFLSFRHDQDEKILAFDNLFCKETEFVMKSIGNGKTVFLAANGKYIRLLKSRELAADAAALENAEQFSVLPLRAK